MVVCDRWFPKPKTPTHRDNNGRAWGGNDVNLADKFPGLVGSRAVLKTSRGREFRTAGNERNVNLGFAGEPAAEFG